MPLRPVEVSVAAPVNQALEQVKNVLFRPFDLARWFVIGFTAWLACLGEQGFGGGSGGGSHWKTPAGKGGGGLRDAAEQARDYVVNHLYWIIPVAIIVGVVLLALWLLVLWLSSRGQFMFLHCVALNRAEVRVPWRKFLREGNSVFRFRLVLALAGMVLLLPLLGILAVAVWRMIMAQQWDPGGIMVLIGGLASLVICSVILAIIGKLTTQFAVAIMFLHGGTCLRAWKTLSGLLGANLGRFILYFLFQILLNLAIGLMLLAVILVTCCIAGCLMAIPYVGTVLLLPILVFQRSYSAYYLAQYGPEFDVFPPPIPPAPARLA